MKRPSFQFYPGDWMNDPALKSCSDLARLLWLEMICIMHEGNPYGYLTLPNGEEIDIKTLAKMSNFEQKNFKKISKLVQELIKNGVAKKNGNNGLIFSSRMVKDERIRTIRAESGSKGGNPILLKQNSSKTLAKDEQTSKQNPTPSSSSSDKLVDLTKNGRLVFFGKKPNLPTDLLKTVSETKKTQIGKWVPNENLIKHLKDTRKDLNIDHHLAKFVYYISASDERKELKERWDLVFSIWIDDTYFGNNGKGKKKMSENIQIKRWQKILSLPDDAIVSDMYTRKKYKRSNLIPKYLDVSKINLHYWTDAETGDTIDANALLPDGEEFKIKA